jgi:hypothetical protein
MEALWDALVSGVSLTDPSILLNVDAVCKTKDATLSLKRFMQFWYVVFLSS